MTAQASLFDVEPVQAEPVAQAEGVDDWVDLRPGVDAFCSCRFCQLATTAAGIVRWEHGPGSRTCERYRNWPPS